MLGLVFGTTPVMADMLVVDVDPPDSDTNPQWVTPSDPTTEGGVAGRALGFSRIFY